MNGTVNSLIKVPFILEAVLPSFLESEFIGLVEFHPPPDKRKKYRH
jgi:hypothetical protein